MEGYDAKFHPPLEKRLECPICLLAQRDPMQTPCGHRFCAVCIQRALRETGPRCPVDNMKVLSSQLFHDNYAKREVLSLHVSCNGDEEGCLWEGQLRELETHCQQCQFISIDCPNGCSFTCKRKQMADHLTDCPNKRVPCISCSLYFSANRLEEHIAASCSNVKLPQSVLQSLEQAGETPQWCGKLNWVMLGREIQTNCFFSSSNSHNLNHLCTSSWKSTIKVFPFIHPNIKSYLCQLRVTAGTVVPLNFYFLSQEHSSSQFLQQLKRPTCSGVSFVDQGAATGHRDVVFFTWNESRKKITVFSTEMRGAKLKELQSQIRRPKVCMMGPRRERDRERLMGASSSSSGASSSAVVQQQQQYGHQYLSPRHHQSVGHQQAAIAGSSAAYPPSLLPMITAPQQPVQPAATAPAQPPQAVPYSSTTSRSMLPDLLSWHMSQSLQPWSIQATAPTGSCFTFPATPPQFIPCNTYPQTFAPFPAIAPHFPIGTLSTLPATAVPAAAINLPYTATVPPQVPSFVGAIRSSTSDVQPHHEPPAGDISVFSIARDIFLVGAHHGGPTAAGPSANMAANVPGGNQDEQGPSAAARYYHREQSHQQETLPASPNTQDSEDMPSPSSLASILMNSPSPLSTSPSMPGLSLSRSSTPSPRSSQQAGTNGSNVVGNYLLNSADTSPVAQQYFGSPGDDSDSSSDLPGPSSRGQPDIPPETARHAHSSVGPALQRQPHARNPTASQSIEPQPSLQDHRFFHRHHHHHRGEVNQPAQQHHFPIIAPNPMDPSSVVGREGQQHAANVAAAMIASPLHTLATAAVIVEQNGLTATGSAPPPPPGAAIGGIVDQLQTAAAGAPAAMRVQPQLVGPPQLPHLMAMGGMIPQNNTNNNQNSSSTVAMALPSSQQQAQTSEQSSNGPNNVPAAAAASSVILSYPHHPHRHLAAAAANIVDRRPQNEALVESPVNYGLSSPPFVPNIFAWPAMTPAGLELHRNQQLQVASGDDPRWSGYMPTRPVVMEDHNAPSQ